MELLVRSVRYCAPVTPSSRPSGSSPGPYEGYRCRWVLGLQRTRQPLKLARPDIGVRCWVAVPQAATAAPGAFHWFVGPVQW